jgi:hypothetical protein
MEKKWTALIVLLLSFALASGGVARAQTFTAGPGAATCAQFGEAYGKNALIEFNFFFWAQGWLSALNAAEAPQCGSSPALRDLFSVSPDLQKATIRQYCEAHPLAQYTEAIIFMRDKYLKTVMVPPRPAGSCKP